MTAPSKSTIPFTFFILAVIASLSIFTWVLLRGEITAFEKPLPIISTLDPSTFLNRRGKSVSFENLKGQVWVADFIFSFCGVTCPAMSQEMEKLQKEIPHNRFSLVSFTADPDRDTPETLTKYAQTYKAGEKWFFLTEKVGHLYQVALKQFHLPILQPKTDSQDITHSQKFVLVDKKSRIRGYYDSNSKTELKNLRRHIRQLLNEKGTDL